MTARTPFAKVIAIAMAVAMALTMVVSAFGVETQPYNANATLVKASVSATDKSYSINITAPTGTTQIKMSATVAQKNGLFYKELDTCTASSNSRFCNKTGSAEIQSGKTYRIKVTAEIYCNGQWDTVERTLTQTA